MGPKCFVYFFDTVVLSAHVKRVSVSRMWDFLWYRCYYEHRLRELVSPVGGIFSLWLVCTLMVCQLKMEIRIIFDVTTICFVLKVISLRRIK